MKPSEFRGQPLCAIYRSRKDRFPFQFGLLKAKLILEHLNEIRAWYEANREPSDEEVYIDG